MKIFFLILLIFINISAQTEYFASADSIKKHLNVLASDNFEGRGVGSKGEILTYNYIANEFNKIGLKKISNETYFQNILLHGSMALDESELYLKNALNEVKLKIQKDYILYNTNSLNYIPQYKDLVFVGYGIIALEFDYNDYLSVDVDNKIVIFLDGEPNSNDPTYFDASNPTIHSNIELKFRVAFSRGAIGAILIPINSYKNWIQVQNEFHKENFSLSSFTNINLNIIINPLLLDIIFQGSKKGIKEIIQDHLRNKIESFYLKTKLKFKGAFRERTFFSRNVIGIKEGSDEKLKDTYLIISAHYDHLGIGKSINGDSIYNGALDNGIGVAVMLEIANVIKKINTKRTIIFIATTAEENGLLGSKYYVDNPIFPLYKTIANVNIDGVPINRNFEGIIGIGSEFSSLKFFIEKVVKKKNYYIEEIPDEFKKFGVFNYSDQFAFAQAGIPSVLIYEGTKNKTKTEKEVIKSFIDYMIEKYHTPFDDLNQNIDYVAAEEYSNFLIEFITEIANSNIEPEWFTGVEFNNARLRNRAEKK
ncbi:MAG: M28 family peptidase [Melioribacteraceae bacterium]|nr:M28 family peptidase [Melioribacteraceae bacterium]